MSRNRNKSKYKNRNKPAAVNRIGQVQSFDNRPAEFTELKNNNSSAYNPRNPPVRIPVNPPVRIPFNLLQMFSKVPMTGMTGQNNFVTDAFSNPAARMGAGTENLLDSTAYPIERLSYDWHLLTGLYRSHWIVRRIIDIVSEDMTKNWYKIKSQISPEFTQKIKSLERRVNLRARIIEGLQLSRLYGGAAGIIIIEGQENILGEPLDYDMIMPGSFKGLVILDRWSGISPELELVADINDRDFGLPEYYTIRSDSLGTGIRVHHSRIVRFTGRNLPYYEKIMEMYWGASEIEHVFEELKKRDNTSWNIALLVFLANLRVYKMDNMEQLGAMNENALADLYQSMTMLNSMMNNQGLQIIGKEDDFDTKQYTFGGLSEIYELFMMDVSGAAEMPVTKLFGRSPAGMNATGESDMQNYYDSIEEKQESYLRPVLDKLLPIMCTSEFGFIPDDLDFEFNPCRRPTEEERKNLSKNIADSVVSVFNAGIINQQIALKELRQSSEQTGMWSNITDDDVKNADTEFSSDKEISGRKFPFGDMSPMGNMFGMDGGPGSGRKPEGGSKEEESGNGGVSNYENAVDERVLSFIGEVTEKGSKGVKPFEVGTINKTHADKLRELNGVNYDGYKIMLTGDAVEHIEKRHGQNGKADKSMSDPKDLARIGYVLNNFDKAELTGEKSWNYMSSSNKPSNVILLSKRVNGNYYVAEAAPDSKKKSIYIISAYKNKK